MTTKSNTKEKNDKVKRNLRKERLGEVVSNSMNKSVTVAVEQRKRHFKYHKYINNTTKFLVHDENEECDVGDFVKIKETRPLSKRKNWRLVNIIEKVK